MIESIAKSSDSVLRFWQREGKMQEAEWRPDGESFFLSPMDITPGAPPAQRQPAGCPPAIELQAKKGCAACALCVACLLPPMIASLALVGTVVK